MTDKANDILRTLLSGQHILETDVAVLKSDVSELKEGQRKHEASISELKTDVSELKEGQRRMENFLVNMENRIMPIIKATYENSILNKEQIELNQKVQSNHSDKLENHELRILRLEQSKS